MDKTEKQPHKADYRGTGDFALRLTALQHLRSVAWAMLASECGLVTRRIMMSLNGCAGADPYEADGAEVTAGPRLPRTKGAVAVIPIQGIIGQNPGGDYWADVYTSRVQGQLLGYVANPSIGAVVLAIDSPGGLAMGTPELGDTIREAREVKPIYAVGEGLMASAAYWIGSQATKLFASRSTKVGSIGVWSMHVDISEALKELGWDVTLISAGEYKTEGNPWEPLSEEAAAETQRVVDVIYDDFLADVARGRSVSKSVVKSDFGQGRLIEAGRAKGLGMIDGVATLPEVLGAIVGPKRGAAARASASLAIEREAGAHLEPGSLGS